jgi:hypothetical protein
MTGTQEHLVTRRSLHCQPGINLKGDVMYRKLAKATLPLAVLVAMAAATLCMACCMPAITIEF